MTLPALGSSQVKGCTDPKANNFNALATVNDGSCTYDTTLCYPEIMISRLPAVLRENSGIIVYDGGIWTHNDSGGKPEIYRIDPGSGKITQTLRINGAIHHDWEDIAQDADHIYIGDFGNNNGNRRDLCIYRISKALIPPRKNGEMTAEKITFRYHDQTEFRSDPQSHDFDCEAMIALGDSLYLFTKNWADLKTRLYALPSVPGDYTLLPQAEFQVNGLITGSDVNPEKKEVTLVGYQDFVSFLLILFDYEGRSFFSGNKRRIELPDLVFTQTEGIAYADSQTVWISCEESAMPPGIFKVNTALWTEPYHGPRSASPNHRIDVEMFRKPNSSKYFFRVRALPDPALKIEIYDRQWARLEQEQGRIFYDMRSSTLSLDFIRTEPGVYFVKLISGDEQHIIKLFVE